MNLSIPAQQDLSIKYRTIFIGEPVDLTPQKPFPSDIEKDQIDQEIWMTIFVKLPEPCRYAR